jgi:hypothetical protein
MPRKWPVRFGKRRLETCRKVTRWPPTSLTEAELALLQHSCTQNCFFAPERTSFAALFSIEFFVRIKKMSAFKKPTTASRATSPQAQPQLYGTSYFLVKMALTGQQNSTASNHSSGMLPPLRLCHRFVIFVSVVTGIIDLFSRAESRARCVPCWYGQPGIRVR